MNGSPRRRLVAPSRRPGVTVRRLVPTLSQRVLAACLGVAALAGCGKGGHTFPGIELPKDAAMYYYEMLVTGDYEDFVQAWSRATANPTATAGSWSHS